MHLVTFLALSLTLAATACAPRSPGPGAHKSSSWYYNFGNACLLADQLPEAIVAYHDGLRLNPNDSGLRDNLDYARARVQYPFDDRGRPEADFWPTWLYQPSAFQTLLLASCLHALAWAFVTRWYMTRRRRLLIRAVVAFGLAATSAGYWLHLKNAREWQAAHPLVVISADRLPMRKGNGPSYPTNADLPLLARGMEARQLHERGDWLQIQVAGGPVGWVEKKAVVVDDP